MSIMRRSHLSMELVTAVLVSALFAIQAPSVSFSMAQQSRHETPSANGLVVANVRVPLISGQLSATSYVGAFRVKLNVTMRPGSTQPVSTSTPYSQLPPTDCISIEANSYAIGTNTENVNALVVNNCWAPVTSAYIELRVTENCPKGIGRGANNVEWAPNPWNVGGPYAQNPVWTVNAVCEICVNHVPRFFPSFYVDNDISSQGQAAWQGRNYTVTGDYQVNGQQLVNSANYQIPC